MCWFPFSIAAVAGARPGGNSECETPFGFATWIAEIQVQEKLFLALI